MTEQTSNTDDEFDLFRVYNFFISGWKTILVATIIAGAASLGWAYTLPVKFQASAQIDGGRVIGVALETTSILAERMRSPPFYSDATLAACQELASSDPAQAVTQMLGAVVSRNSNFVSVSARMKSRDGAQLCLKSVLEDVRLSQKGLFEPLKSSYQRELDQLKSELIQKESERAEEITLFNNQLAYLQNKLVETERAIQLVKLNESDLEVSDQKFSASSLLFSIISEKENLVIELSQKILDLESRIRTKAGRTETEADIFELKSKINTLERQLSSPVTQQAEFLTPIFSPKSKVEPRKAMITASGIVIGGLAGILILLLQGIVQDFKRRRLLEKGMNP